MASFCEREIIMKDDSLADLGYIKIYLKQFLKDNEKALSDIDRNGYNDFTIKRCLELVEEIVNRENKKSGASS